MMAALLRGVHRTLHHIEDGLIVAVLLFMILLAVAQIVLRNFFGTSLVWIEPLLQNAAATLTLGPPKPLAGVLASRSDLTRAQAAVSRGEIFRGELPLARADGTLWCLLALRRILDPATGRPCLLLTAEDTSRARAAEEQAAALQGRAEELIRLNHSLETLVRIASHDLREPLRNISNYTSAYCKH